MILGHSRNVEVTHEAFPVPWYEPEHAQMGKLLKHLKTKAMQGILCGEVGQQLIPHVARIREVVPELKVVTMHRDRHKVVESFLAVTNELSSVRPADRELILSMFPDTHAKNLPYVPIIDGCNPTQAWSFYWKMCEGIMGKMDEPVFRISTDHLNNDESLGQLMDFLEIPPADRVLPERRCWNSTQEIKERIYGSPGTDTRSAKP